MFFILLKHNPNRGKIFVGISKKVFLFPYFILLFFPASAWGMGGHEECVKDMEERRKRKGTYPAPEIEGECVVGRGKKNIRRRFLFRCDVGYKRL